MQVSSSIADLEAEVALTEVEVAQTKAKPVRARQVLVGYHDHEEEIGRTLQGLAFSMKTFEDNYARLFALQKAHLAELLESPLFKIDIEAVAMKEAQKLLNAEIQAINLKISDIIHDIHIL